MARQQNVFPRLRHRTVRGTHHQDRSIHLRGAGDHVLHIVGVARAVNVRIVPVVRLILDVADRDRHDLAGIPAPLTLARLRHFVIADEFRHPAIRADLGQRTRQRRLAMVHVPDRPNVHVGLSSLKFRLLST